jgi:dTDP-4-amino-4,6-dideoxygalactose transaminase
MNFKIYISDLEYGVEEEQAVLEVLKDRWLTMGPRTAQFEKAFSKWLDGTPCALVSSGTTALHLAVHALGLSRGDEVILPSLTFAATANVVVQCGARCVFADIERLNVPLLSPSEVARKITPRTRIIMPVHYAGFSADMEGLSKIVKKEKARRKKAGETRPLYIVEDAAHTAGARDSQGRPLGAIGDAGCFSLFSNKNIAAGEGGIIATKDASLHKRILLMRSHGLTCQTWERHKDYTGDQAYLYDLMEPGFNYRPTELTAALALTQLEKLPRINETRKALFLRAHERLKGISGVTLPFAEPASWGNPSYHILPVLLPDEETQRRVAKSLAKEGVQTSHHYRPLHTMSYYRKKTPRAECDLRRTEEYAAREITLPLHTRLSFADMDEIINLMMKALFSN